MSILIARGKVVDSETNEPLPGAHVVAKRPNACVTTPCPKPTFIVGTSTDHDGSFRLEAPTGTFIEVSYIGYRKAVPMFISDVSQTIKLEQDATMHDAVTITANRTYYKYILILLVLAVLGYFITTSK